MLISLLAGNHQKQLIFSMNLRTPENILHSRSAKKCRRLISTWILSLSWALLPHNKAQAFRMMTWNIERLGTEQDLAHPLTGTSRPRMTADYEALAHYFTVADVDLALIQEVKSKEVLGRIIDENAYAIEMAQSQNSMHIAAVYRRQHSVKISELNLGADPNGRSMIAMQIAIGPKTLHLLAVHLRNGCHTRAWTSNPDCQILQQQLLAIARWARQRADEGSHYGLVGDFNRAISRASPCFWPPGADPIINELQRYTDDQSPSCWPNQRMIDHFFFPKPMIYSGPLQIRGGGAQRLLYSSADKQQALILSDHCPLIIDLRYIIDADHHNP